MEFFLIFGPPGAGKGTQSALLVERYNFRHISTGDLLRREIASGSERGLMIKSIIDQGNFVDDSTVLEMLESEISTLYNDADGFILDGYPRTLTQAADLDRLLERYESGGLSALFSLEVEDSVIVERIRKRAEVEGRADDSSLETVLKRIETYHTKTEPLIEYYKERGKYFSIEGDAEVEKIFKDICTIIKRDREKER